MSEERRYFVYIMANASKRLYTGMTNSIRRRVREHKLKLTPGFAAKYNITRLVYFESFEDVRNAIEWEKQIKAWTRAKRLTLVESTNPSGTIFRASGISCRRFALHRKAHRARAALTTSGTPNAETKIPMSSRIKCNTVQRCCDGKEKVWAVGPGGAD